MLATDYPLLNVFWTLLMIFLFVVYVWVIIMVLADVFKSHDMGGVAKALWFILVLLLPLFGVLLYLILRGHKMQQHADDKPSPRETAALAAIQNATGSPVVGAADEIEKLAKLRDQGLITDEEFEHKKRQCLY
jgi:hypothetical protein